MSIQLVMLYSFGNPKGTNTDEDEIVVSLGVVSLQVTFGFGETDITRTSREKTNGASNFSELVDLCLPT